MTIVSRQWVPGAAVVPQERGPGFLGVEDGADWSEGIGFYRGFFSAFRVRAGKSVWFHFPLPTPVEQSGKPLFLDGVSLLWECSDGADIGWMTVQHGGMDRIELTPRMTAPAYEPVPFEPEPEFAPYCPVTARRLSDLPLSPRLPLRFGVQLCVMIHCPDSDGTVRFYGAGAAFSDLA